MGTRTTAVRSLLDRVDDNLDPRRARLRAIEELNEMFALGTPPDPLPDGLLRGRAIASTVNRGLDGFGRRLSNVYMPWLGKKFDAAAEGGLNILTPSAIKPMKVMWPSYEPAIFVDRIEAFPFRTRVAPGAVDKDLAVLKIDYDFEDNPAFIIRRVLDELVQVDEELYLGKVLLRIRGNYTPIGFFSLEK